MKRLLTIMFGVFLLGCHSIEIDKNVQLDSGAGNVKNKNKSETTIVTVPLDQGPPEVVIREKPIYIPSGTPYNPQSVSGRAAVEQSNAAGIMKPSEYSRAAMIYDFDPDWVYEIYTQPLRATDIRLDPGEQATETPFISDSERWLLGAGVSHEGAAEVQHFYVKPTSAGLEASLIINTDRRTYHIILKSFRDIHMPMVRWRYPSTGMPNNYISSTAPAVIEGVQGVIAGGGGIDPRFLSFNYRITYGFFSRPKWMPELVYDDGKKTYITFPKDVLQSEMPSIFENRDDVINYRVLQNVIIIDKRIEKITVKIEKKQIVIEKKRSK